MALLFFSMNSVISTRSDGVKLAYCSSGTNYLVIRMTDEYENSFDRFLDNAKCS